MVSAGTIVALRKLDKEETLGMAITSSIGAYMMIQAWNSFVGEQGSYYNALLLAEMRQNNLTDLISQKYWAYIVAFILLLVSGIYAQKRTYAHLTAVKNELNRRRREQLYGKEAVAEEEAAKKKKLEDKHSTVQEESREDGDDGEETGEVNSANTEGEEKLLPMAFGGSEEKSEQ